MFPLLFSYGQFPSTVYNTRMVVAIVTTPVFVLFYMGYQSVISAAQSVAQLTQ